VSVSNREATRALLVRSHLEANVREMTSLHSARADLLSTRLAASRIRTQSEMLAGCCGVKPIRAFYRAQEFTRDYC